jgi:hypothetical protein
MAIAQAQLRSDYLSISTPAYALNKPYNDVSKAKVLPMVLPMVCKPDLPRYVNTTPVFVGIAG